MIAGVDGRRAGWVVASAEAWPAAEVRWEVCRAFADVLRMAADCAAIMVDMPVGLPRGSERRRCDEEARALLGPAWTRVFPAPPRECLRASTPRQFQRLHRELTGAGATLPLWGIVRKIREVDEALANSRRAAEKVHEFHPELTWLRLGSGPAPSKHTADGIAWREAVLARFGLAAPRKLARGVKADDVLDATIGLAAAGLDHCIPAGPPPRDDHGLPMRIYY